MSLIELNSVQRLKKFSVVLFLVFSKVNYHCWWCFLMLQILLHSLIDVWLLQCSFLIILARIGIHDFYLYIHTVKFFVFFDLTVQRVLRCDLSRHRRLSTNLTIIVNLKLYFLLNNLFFLVMKFIFLNDQLLHAQALAALFF